MSAPVYSVTLHHLSLDAKMAGLAYPDEQLLAVNIAQLRDLLYALAEVAARMTIYEPATPEIRIKTERDVFVIRTRYRRLCFVGWEQMLRGEEHSVAYILSTITGTAEPVKIAPKVERTFTSPPISATTRPVEPDAVPASFKIALMAVLIVGFTGTGVWLLLRPPPTLAPPFTLLSDFESQALLTKAAGEYETGTQVGDRRLVIDSDGTLHLAKYGPKRVITDEGTRVSRGGMADGHAVLITSDPSVLAIKDADHVVLYGSAYRRIVR